MRHRKDLGERKAPRIVCQRAGYIIVTPNAPWVECEFRDISEGGVCIQVGELAIPEIFAITFTESGDVRRLCRLAWRRGGLIGAQFIKPDQLRARS